MTTYKCPDCKTWFEVEEQNSGKLAVEVAGAKENFVFCSRELPLWCPRCEDKSEFRHNVELKPAIKKDWTRHWSSIRRLLKHNPNN